MGTYYGDSNKVKVAFPGECGICVDIRIWRVNICVGFHPHTPMSTHSHTSSPIADATIDDMHKFEQRCLTLDVTECEATKLEDKARILRAVRRVGEVWGFRGESGK